MARYNLDDLYSLIKDKSFDLSQLIEKRTYDSSRLKTCSICRNSFWGLNDVVICPDCAGKMKDMLYAKKNENKYENEHTPLFEAVVDAIRENTKDEPVRGIWINGDDEIVTATAAQAYAIADLFEAAGYDIMHAHPYDPDGTNQDVKGMWSVYVEGNKCS